MAKKLSAEVIKNSATMPVEILTITNKTKIVSAILSSTEEKGVDFIETEIIPLLNEKENTLESISTTRSGLEEIYGI